MRRAVLVTIDGWGTNLVGAYGNPLCETPNLDRFAAYGVVFDRAYTSSTSMAAVLQSISNGLHPNQPRLTGQIELAEILQTIGKQSILMSDDSGIAESPWAQAFNESFYYDPDQDTGRESFDERTDWSDARLARFTEAALGELSRFGDAPDGLPDFAWIHLSGLSKIWDAPYEYRLALCDDDDPEPPRGALPSDFEVNRGTDPDVIFGAICGASAQGKVIDQLWEWIEAFLDQFSDRKECLVILAGTRGYPLGEHRSVGYSHQDLYTELVHIPLIVRLGAMPIGTRDDSIVQPMSIWATVMEWLVDSPEAKPFVAAEIAKRPLSANLAAVKLKLTTSERVLPAMCLIAADENSCLQVPRWSAVWPPSEESPTESQPEIGRIYLSPDDRWQQNNVTPRAAEITETMFETRENLQKWLAAGAPRESTPMLSEILTRPV